MANYAQSSLAAAVKAESINWLEVGGLYGQAARELATLFTESGNAQVHLYMTAAQDATGDPLVWNRSFTGLKKALSALPIALVFTSTRDFRPTHRTKNALFELATKDSVTADKAAIAKANEEKAAKIERDAAAERAAEKAKKDEEEQAAYMQTTAQDIADDVLEHCGKLGIAPEDIARLILESMDESARSAFLAQYAPKAPTAKTAPKAKAA